MTDPITTLIGTVLDTGANALTTAALGADPQLRARMQKLSGNCIEILSIQPSTAWHIEITEQSVIVHRGSAAAPNVSVSGPAMALASWLLPASLPRSSEIQIDGDQVLLEEFTSAVQLFRPDFAEPLEQILGGDISARILGGAELGLQGARSAVEGLRQQIGQQFTGSNGNQFVRVEDLETVLSGIDELRLRMDRLAAQMAQEKGARERRRRKRGRRELEGT